MASLFWTLTACECGENGRNQQLVGSGKLTGFLPANINNAQVADNRLQVVDLSYGPVGRGTGAFLGVIRNYSSDINDRLINELSSLNWDSKVWNARQKKVQNKKARHNLCFQHKAIYTTLNEEGIEVTAYDDEHKHILQQPSYENGRGTIYDFTSFPALNELSKRIHQSIIQSGLEMKLEDLVLEGNCYYDASETYIGFHGDSERNMVFGVRVSATIPNQILAQPIYFGWWLDKEYVWGSMKAFLLDGGDAYIMSQKATGNDWGGGSSNKAHLRHAAGELFTLLSNAAWKPYENDNEIIHELIKVGPDDEIISDISFPLGGKDLVLADLKHVFIDRKPTSKKEQNWLAKYEGTYVSPKRKNDDDE